MTVRGNRLLLATLAICGIVTGSLKAEPYLAVRTGFKCSQCHVNQTGGGKRTAFGNIYSQRFLAGSYLKSDITTSFTPNLSPNISIGGNFRLRNTNYYSYSYADTLVYTAQAASLLNVTEGNFYIEAQIIPDRLTVYIDQMVSPNTSTREAFGLLQGLPINGYLKAGKILLPYGYRLWDDDAFIRSATGFTYSGPDLGVEIGIDKGKFSVSMAATMEQFSGLGTWVGQHARLGVSWQRAIDGIADTRMYGIFAGLHAGRFTLLCEMDQIEWGTTRQQAFFAELDFLILRGYNLKLAYNLFDRNLDIPIERDGQERIVFGIEIFPFQFIQFSVFYNINNFIPQNLPKNQDMLAMELHFFF